MPRRNRRGRPGEPLEKLIRRTEAAHAAQDVWQCKFCGYRNTDVVSKQCQNCGRDHMGRPGEPPDEPRREMRPGIHSKAAQGFTKDEYDAEYGP